jgi:hypothetical protein
MGGDISYIRNGYLILRTGELERKSALTFYHAGSTKSSYRYSINPLDKSSNILLNLEPKDKIYDDGYVQIFVMQ